ncbi:MAG TPA: hypothetical protein QGG18_09110 [Rhodospirillales bacterium]|nr:hypothetical protein [Rhodospirillales bacterium]
MDNTDIDKTIGALVYVPVSLLGVMIMFGFNKKIEIEIPDGKGGSKKIKVSEKQFDKWVKEGKIAKIDKCKVNILDPINGIREEYWEVGNEGIDQKTYNNLGLSQITSPYLL